MKKKEKEMSDTMMWIIAIFIGIMGAIGIATVSTFVIEKIIDWTTCKPCELEEYTGSYNFTDIVEERPWYTFKCETLPINNPYSVGKYKTSGEFKATNRYKEADIFAEFNKNGCTVELSKNQEQ